jgi:hypothetical protein
VLPGVNFTNVLRAAFTYVSCTRSFLSLPVQKLRVERWWNWAQNAGPYTALYLSNCSRIQPWGSFRKFPIKKSRNFNNVGTPLSMQILDKESVQDSLVISGSYVLIISRERSKPWITREHCFFKGIEFQTR